MKRLTESQIRQIIKQELKNVLFEQDSKKEEKKKGFNFRNLIIPAIAAALMFVPGHEVVAKGADGGPSGGGKTIEQILEEAGVTPKVLQELGVGLNEKDIKKFSSLYKYQKELEDKLEKAKLEGEPEEQIQKLTKQVNNVFTGENVSPDELERMKKTGSAVIKYLRAASPEELKSYEELTPEKVKTLQSKSLARSISTVGQSEDIKVALTNDLKELIKISREDPVTAPAKTGAEAVLFFAANNNLLPQDKETFNYLDIIKAAKANGYGDYLLLDPTNFTDKQLKDLNNKLGTMSVKDAKAKLQENKVSKLRQRLNELRGVYV